MTFFILAYRETETSEWENDFSSKYNSGAEAQRYCKSNNDYNTRWNYPKRWRVRKVVDTDDDNFIAREAAKNHTPVPWEISDYHQKYFWWRLEHLDPDNDKQIRFFTCLEAAVEGKYVSLKMSTFLARHSDFDEKTCQEILTKAGFYSGTTEFGIAEEPEDIQNVYLNGPTSCMNDPEDYSFDLPHPVTVYGNSDLAVAYIKHGEDEYTARGVIYPDKKIYYTIYGHSELLRHHLHELGYSRDNGDGFHGAKISAIRTKDGYNWLMPYVDACSAARLVIDGDERHFVIDPNGDFDIQTTEGYAYED